MTTRAEITGLHFTTEADGGVAMRLTFAGITSTLAMSHKTAVIGLGDLMIVLAPTSPLAAAMKAGAVAAVCDRRGDASDAHRATLQEGGA